MRRYIGLSLTMVVECGDDVVVENDNGLGAAQTREKTQSIHE
jgi:hypothetical protein